MTEIRSPRKGIAIAIGVAVFSMGLLLFQFVYINIYLKKQAEENSKRIASLTSGEIANSVRGYFQEAFHFSRYYTQNLPVFRRFKVPRKEISSMMTRSLAKSENIQAIWTMWEPEAYDGMDQKFRNDGFRDPTGRLNISCYRDSGKVKMEIPDTTNFHEDFYLLPKKLLRPIISDPFKYEYKGGNKSIYVTSVVFPVVQDDDFLGVVGVDIDMESLQRKYSDQAVYGNTNVTIMSGSGIIVTNKYPEYIGRNIQEYFGDVNHGVVDSLSQMKEFRMITSSVKNGTEVIRYFFPVETGDMNFTWYVIIEVPLADVFRNLSALKTFSSILLVASLLLLLYLIFNIIDRRIKEKLLISSHEAIEASERKIKESLELKSRSEKVLEAIFNQTLNLAGLISTDDIVIRYNKPALDFMNKKDDDIRGKPFIENSFWSDDPGTDSVLLHAMREAKKGLNFTTELEYIKPDGKISQFLLSVRPISGDTGELHFILVEGVDISYIKETEMELKKYQEHLEDMVDERTWEVHKLNQKLFAANQDLQTVNTQLMAQKEELSCTLKNLNDAQEKLIFSEKMASLGIFTAGIAHEINNPVNFISAGSQGLSEQLEKLACGPLGQNEDFRKFIDSAKIYSDSISTGVTRTTEIISSLRNYSGSNTGSFIKYDIEKCIRDSLVILRNHYKHRIIVNEQYEPGCIIECMPGKLNQVFVNLITNAIDSIPQEGEINISTRKSGSQIIIKIEDSGTGIPEENMPRIYDPFFTTKAFGKGIGLGLYIVYGIIEQHKGYIDIESFEGKGTTVTLKFPLN